MKTPPLILLVLSIILITLPSQCFDTTEQTIITTTRPFAYLYGKTIPIDTETTDPKKTESLSSKDKIKLLEQKIIALNNDIVLLKNDNLSLVSKLKNVSDFKEFQSENNIKERYDIIIGDVIIKSDVSQWRRSILINRGSSDGIKRGLTVVSGKYLVGKISEVGPFTSRIQLITDPSFRSQVMVVPPLDTQEKETVSAQTDTDKKATKSPLSGVESSPTGFGVLAGISFNRSLVKWVSRELKVSKGWNAFSAPDPNAIIPRGLIVGKVNNVSIDGFFYTLGITPAVDFYNLTSLLILVPKNK